jgi:chromosome segregation ATPase
MPHHLASDHQIHNLNKLSIGFIISGMSEETTQNLPDGRSFEERVFARLDAIDSLLQSLEQQAEQRAVETKPIWERALAEILEVKERLDALEHLSNQIVRKIDVLGKDMLALRADQAGIEDRLEKLESRSVS